MLNLVYILADYFTLTEKFTWRNKVSKCYDGSLSRSVNKPIFTCTQFASKNILLFISYFAITSKLSEERSLSKPESYICRCITTDTFINKISIGTVAYINLYKRIVTNGNIRFIPTEIESNTKLDFELRYRINRDLIISYVDIVLTLFGLCFTFCYFVWNGFMFLHINHLCYLFVCVFVIDFCELTDRIYKYLELTIYGQNKVNVSGPRNVKQNAFV